MQVARQVLQVRFMCTLVNCLRLMLLELVDETKRLSECGYLEGFRLLRIGNVERSLSLRFGSHEQKAGVPSISFLVFRVLRLLVAPVEGQMAHLHLLLRCRCVSLPTGAVTLVALVRELFEPGKAAFLHGTGGAVQLLEGAVDAVEAGVGGAVGRVGLDAGLLATPLLLQRDVPSSFLPLLLLLLLDLLV